MPWGIVIPADEEAPIEFRLFGQLTDYQEAVGGWFEAVDLDDISASFFVNEEGKVIGLPQNRRATLLWWVNHRAMHGRDVIMGDTVLIGLPDDEGDTQDVPGALVALLMKTDHYKYEVQTLDSPDSWHGNQARYDDYFKACNAALALSERWALVSNIRVLPA